MEFLKKRQITDFGGSPDKSGLAFLDVTYTHSNKIFHLLMREGLLKDDRTRETLASFLEVVSFVHCWIELELERRLPRRAFEGLSKVLSDMKTSWGSFFAHPPEEPRLEHESVESVHSFMTRRCGQYHASYSAGLRTGGRVHALRTFCAAFLANAVPGYASRLGGSDKNQERTDNLNEPILHYIGETVYELDRAIHFILAEYTL